jgi:DNA polymerase III sliding clamp (beta) subunit (PCNA family)
MTIATSKFQDMVAKANKGASENKIIPLTSLIALELHKGVLTLTTTDSINTLKVIETGVDGDDMYAVLPVDLFSKLVARTTSDTISISLVDKVLEVKGNGSYNIPLPLEDGEIIRFPEYKFTQVGEPETLTLTAIKSMLSVNKSSVGKNVERTFLSGYFIGEKVLTTDGYAACINDMKLVSTPIFMHPEMLELLALNNTENIKFSRNGKSFLFETPNLVLFGTEHEEKEKFPDEDILSYLDEKFSSSCKVPKESLQKVIDRLSLFIEPYDKNGAYLEFTTEGLKMYSKRSSSVEVVPYTASNEFRPFVCCVDIPMLKTQVDSNPGEFIEIWYGHDSAIKLTADKVTQVIALLEDDSLGGAVNG